MWIHNSHAQLDETQFWCSGTLEHCNDEVSEGIGESLLGAVVWRHGEQTCTPGDGTLSFKAVVSSLVPNPMPRFLSLAVR